MGKIPVRRIWPVQAISTTHQKTPLLSSRQIVKKEDGIAPQMATTFQYDRVDSSKREIRLLCLLGVESPEDTEPSCTLSYALLLSNPKYVALLYVWVISAAAHSISVNGRSFYVSENLYVALRHLQSKDDMVLWIDAICISQNDDEEKGEQVRPMQEIYLQAMRVVVWLDPSTMQTDTAMYWIRTLGESLLRMGIERLTHDELGSWDNIDEEEGEQELAGIKTEIKRYMNQFIQSLRQGKNPLFWRHSDFGSRPWFTRA